MGNSNRTAGIALRAMLTALVAIHVSSSFAQAPRTISHQGLLTDNTGAPLADASYDLAFAIYDVMAGGTALWSDSKSVTTSNGVFNTTLGPIAGVNFGDPTWLGITVEADDEMAPRTPVTSVPSAFALVLPYNAIADTADPVFSVENAGAGSAVFGENSGTGVGGHFYISNPLNDEPALLARTEGSGFGIHSTDPVLIQTASLGSDGSESIDEKLTIRGARPGIGLYSTAVGLPGSGLHLGELSAGSMTNKWSIHRASTIGKAPLRFSFGTDEDPALNPVVAQIDTAGVAIVSAVRYSNPRTHYASIPVAAFRPARMDSSVAYLGTNSFTIYGGTSGEGIIAPVTLPDGAEIKELTCSLRDNSASIDLRCFLYVVEFVGPDAFIHSPASVETSGASPEIQTLATTSFTGFQTVDNSSHTYSVRVDPPTGLWSDAGNDVFMLRAVIRYEIDEAH